MWAALRLGWLSFWGGVANRAGYPGLVRAGRWRSEHLEVDVTVRTSRLFTVVTVNGVDVYFYRLSGGYDGIGASCRARCRGWDAPRPVDSAWPDAPCE